MNIEPASIDQLRVAQDGKLVLVTADVGGVADSLRRLDPCLRLRYSESADIWIVYRVHRHGEPCAEDDPERTEELVLTAKDCDQRIVRRLEYIDGHGRSGYDFARELEQGYHRRQREQRQEFAERVGENAEQVAYAMRKDLGLGPYKGRIFKPREVR